MRQKGRGSFWVQTLLVVAWFLGEITAGFLAVTALTMLERPPSAWPFPIHLVPIAGALLATLMTFLFAFSLPDQLPRTIAQRTPMSKT